MLGKDLLNKLTLYFEERSDISFAFLFGSHANGSATNRSDVDIAIYFYPVVRHPVEFETEGTYEDENIIWANIETIVSKEVDMIVLNKVPATVAAACLRGQPLMIKDSGLYLDFMTAVTDEADSFMDYIISDYQERYAV
ncbi:MAG: nucleotidyltransferase domain-containing protein [Porphyromonadaceae bacterium]|nr:MAG: nucleotidyltransferase domain-containing protein [Porphyromonadaceae bacterium]